MNFAQKAHLQFNLRWITFSQRSQPSFLVYKKKKKVIVSSKQRFFALTAKLPNRGNKERSAFEVSRILGSQRDAMCRKTCGRWACIKCEQKRNKFRTKCFFQK